jgi:hypothetical protein
MFQPFTSTRLPHLRAVAWSFLSAVLAGACSESNGGGGTLYVPRSTSASAADNSIVRVQDRWVLFQADEFTTGPGGTPLNGDGDRNDQVAFLVDMVSQRETNLGIAADDLAILGTGAGAQILLVVSEGVDGIDWNEDADAGDVVLLTVPAGTAGSATPTLLATLSGPGEPLVSIGNRAYFVEDETAGEPLSHGETAIAFARLDANQSVVGPIRVRHGLVDLFTGLELVKVLCDPDLVGADGGALFFTMNETSEVEIGGSTPGVNLNGLLSGLEDFDATDEHVLGVLDTTDPDARARGLSLAVVSDAKTVRAVRTGTAAGSGGLIAFLVSEAGQGGRNLNHAGAIGLPSGWEPPQCTAPDTDTEDLVLFAIPSPTFFGSPLFWQNTGLAGSDRVLALEGEDTSYVGTLSTEADASCDLNADGDAQDTVFRFAPVGGGTAFVTSVKALLAVETVEGGVSGVTDLDGRFVAVISEADNDQSFDGIPGKDHDLLAWLDPDETTNSTPQPWIFDHSPTSGIQAAGTDWMAERPQRDRLAMTYQEAVHGAPINTGGDSDPNDSIPTFARFDPIDDFDFPGPPLAGQANNAGIALSDNDLAFYRVDEGADNRDWNSDGDKEDLVLFRTTVSTLQDSTFLDVLNDLQRPAVELGGTVGAAYLADEAMAHADFNQDGDAFDLVLRWFRLE